MSVVDKILLAQSLVRQAEAGEIDWRRLYDAVFDDKIEGPWTTAEYVADLYFRFRLTEAAAYQFRQGQPHFPSLAVTNMVAICHTQTANIHEALRYFEGLTPRRRRSRRSCAGRSRSSTRSTAGDTEAEARNQVVLSNNL